MTSCDLVLNYDLPIYTITFDDDRVSYWSYHPYGESGVIESGIYGTNDEISMDNYLDDGVVEDVCNLFNDDMDHEIDLRLLSYLKGKEFALNEFEDITGESTLSKYMLYVYLRGSYLAFGGRYIPPIIGDSSNISDQEIDEEIDEMTGFIRIALESL